MLTPFRSQVALLKRELREAGMGEVPVSTVHKAQGREYDLVLFSPVYGRRDGPMLQEPYLLNVAATRAREAFLIFGNPQVVCPEAPAHLAAFGRAAREIPERPWEGRDRGADAPAGTRADDAGTPVHGGDAGGRAGTGRATEDAKAGGSPPATALAIARETTPAATGAGIPAAAGTRARDGGSGRAVATVIGEERRPGDPRTEVARLFARATTKVVVRIEAGGEGAAARLGILGEMARATGRDVRVEATVGEGQGWEATMAALRAAGAGKVDLVPALENPRCVLLFTKTGDVCETVRGLLPGTDRAGREAPAVLLSTTMLAEILGRETTIRAVGDTGTPALAGGGGRGR